MEAIAGQLTECPAWREATRGVVYQLVLRFRVRVKVLIGRPRLFYVSNLG